jgi:hypothetical protein
MVIKMILALDVATIDREDGCRECLPKILSPLGSKSTKVSRTPPEKMTSDDEEKYVGQEQRAAKRMEDDDLDY